MSKLIQTQLYVIQLRRQFRSCIAEAKALGIELASIRGTIAGLLACVCGVDRSQARILACVVVL